MLYPLSYGAATLIVFKDSPVGPHHPEPVPVLAHPEFGPQEPPVWTRSVVEASGTCMMKGAMRSLCRCLLFVSLHAQQAEYATASSLAGGVFDFVPLPKPV